MHHIKKRHILIKENIFWIFISYVSRSCIEEVEANVDLLEQKLDKVLLFNSQKREESITKKILKFLHTRYK